LAALLLVEKEPAGNTEGEMKGAAAANVATAITVYAAAAAAAPNAAADG